MPEQRPTTILINRITVRIGSGGLRFSFCFPNKFAARIYVKKLRDCVKEKLQIKIKKKASRDPAYSGATAQREIKE